MAEWDRVITRANTETELALSILNDGHVEIEDYYPELHSPKNGRSFSNTLGSNLVPDLLTSERVVVDVYDWTSPDELINVYGVDLKFLESLRDQDLITLCANLPLERYQNCSWLHPILADDRTIFRSVRTPIFFKSRDQGFEERCIKSEHKFEKYFQSLSSDELDRCLKSVKSVYPPQDAATLASVLANWTERLVAIDSQVAADIGEDFERQVVEKMPQLMQLQRIMVSPHSAALGGPMKISRTKWVDIFGKEDLDKAAIEGYVRYNKLNSYFSEMTLELDDKDFSNKNQWNNLSNARRTSLLEFLADVDSRHEILRAEQTLRGEVAKKGDQNPSRESIRGLVDGMEEHASKVLAIQDSLTLAIPTVFGALHDEWAMGFALGGGAIGSKYILGEHVRKFTEELMPKLRVVRLLGKNNKK